MIDVNKTVKTSADVIERVLFIYQHRDDVTYCLGCSGEVVGRDKKVENSFKYYYQNGYKEKIDNSIAYGFVSIDADQAWSLWSNKYKGKMAFDCSGLIDWCLGYMGNHKYTSWNFKSFPTTAASGSACWKDGHCGIFIGYNNFIHIPTWGHTLELQRVDEYNWKSYHKIEGIQYV